jgi:hypothetical protein
VNGPGIESIPDRQLAANNRFPNKSGDDQEQTGTHEERTDARKAVQSVQQTGELTPTITYSNVQMPYQGYTNIERAIRM